MKRILVVMVAAGICLGSMLASALDTSNIKLNPGAAERIHAAGSQIIPIKSSFSQAETDYMVFAKGKTEFVIFGRLKAGMDLATIEPKLMYLGISQGATAKQMTYTRACAEVPDQPDAANGAFFSCVFNPSAVAADFGKIRFNPPQLQKIPPELSSPQPPPEWHIITTIPVEQQAESNLKRINDQLSKPMDLWLPVGTYWFVTKASNVDKSPPIVIKKLIENYVDANSDNIPDNIIPPKAEETTDKGAEQPAETTEQPTDQTGELSTSPVVTPTTTETPAENAAEGGGMCTLVPMAAANPLGLILLTAAVIPLARRKK